MSHVITFLRRAAIGLLLASTVLASAPVRAGFALELSVPQKQYLVDELLFVTVAIKNAGKSDARFVSRFDPNVLLDFEISEPGEQPHKYMHHIQFMLPADYCKKAAMLLGPGEEYSAAVDLSKDMAAATGGRLLSRPGEYTIQAEYAIPKDEPGGPVSLRSNRIALTVVEPRGDDKQAHDVLQEAARVHGRGLWNAYAESADDYEKVIGQFPRSRYATYARCFLGGIYHLNAGKQRQATDGKSVITPEGLALIVKAASLHVAAGMEAGDTPFGVYATSRAGNLFAQAGNVEEAQRLLEKAFVSPAATNEDRLEILSWLSLVQDGILQRDSGIEWPSTGVLLRLPLQSFAKALGFSVIQDIRTGMVTVSSPRVTCAFKPGSDAISINGQERTGFKTWVEDGQVQVSIAVIGTLLKEHYQTERYDFLLKPTQLP